MAEILIRYRVTRQPIVTGLNTDVVQFDTLPDVALPLRCPSCGETHYWQPHDAWLAHPGEKTRH